MLVSPIIYLSFPILEFKAKGKWILKRFSLKKKYFFIEVEDVFFEDDEGI